MTRNDPGQSTDPDRQDLMGFLAAQRRSVLAIVDGLSEAAMRTSVVPSAWTPIGLVEHLAGAEYFWIRVVMSGQGAPAPVPDDSAPADDSPPAGAMGPFVTDRPVGEVVEEYRRMSAENDALIRDLPLNTPPRFRPPWAGPDEAADLRWVLLHLIEETARHAGHLDIARELLDGKTGLGPR